MATEWQRRHSPFGTLVVFVLSLCLYAASAGSTEIVKKKIKGKESSASIRVSLGRTGQFHGDEVSLNDGDSVWILDEDGNSAKLKKGRVKVETVADAFDGDGPPSGKKISVPDTYEFTPIFSVRTSSSQSPPISASFDTKCASPNVDPPSSSMTTEERDKFIASLSPLPAPKSCIVKMGTKEFSLTVRKIGVLSDPMLFMVPQYDTETVLSIGSKKFNN